MPGSNMVAEHIARFFSGRLLVREEGQTLAEYALIFTLVVVVVVTALIVFRDKVNSVWSSVNDTFEKV